MNILKKSTAIVVTATLLFLQSAPVFAQPKAGGAGEANFRSMEQYNIKKLEEKWAQYTKDKGFNALVEKAKRDGFTRIGNDARTAWGFQGQFTKGASDRAVAAEVCAFDFVKKTPEGVQMASLLWRQVGSETYKAVIVFPVGETDANKAFVNSVEHYADANGDVQLARSFRTCFNSCLLNSAAFCGTLAAACFGFVLTIGVTGIGLLPALGILGACAGLCAMPIAICAVRC